MTLFDCCHSGTVLDLNYRYSEQEIGRGRKNKVQKNGTFLSISGCCDNQQGIDSYIGGEYCGAATWAVLRCLSDDNQIINITDNANAILQGSNYAQTIVLSSNDWLDIYSSYEF